MTNFDSFFLTSIKKRIMFDIMNNFSNIFSMCYFCDYNEVYDNEWDLYLRTNKITLISNFDEDVYDYLKNLLTGNNSFAIFEELKRKGVI